jgi:hypothetical protein
MTTATEKASAQADRRGIWEHRLAGPMFFLALAFLVALAGLIHRFPRLNWGDPEAYWILGAVAGLWVIFLIEAALRLQHRRPWSLSAWTPLAGTLACGLLPPLRMGAGTRAAQATSGCPALVGEKSMPICALSWSASSASR